MQVPTLEPVPSRLQDPPVRRPANFTRNLFHVGNAVGVALLAEFVLPTWGARVAVAATGFGLAWGMEIARRRSPEVNRFLMRIFAPVAHPDEARRVNSATWYTTAVLLLALLFPVWAGLAGLAVLGFGDPVAAIVGRRIGRTRLASGRSLEGTLAFVVAGFLAAWGSLALLHPEIGSVALVALVAAAVGAIAELLARSIDDNLVIPVLAAFAAFVTGIVA